MIFLKNNRYSYNGSDFIGAGSYGLIFKGMDHSTNTPVAIKVIKKMKITDSYLG